jgi:hypothetical protein
MRRAAHGTICSAHGYAVTCTGDLDASSVLTGYCPYGGEAIYIETAVDGPKPGSDTVRPYGAPGGVHDPMKNVAFAQATNDEGVPVETKGGPFAAAAADEAPVPTHAPAPPEEPEHKQIHVGVEEQDARARVHPITGEPVVVGKLKE